MKDNITKLTSVAGGKTECPAALAQKELNRVINKIIDTTDITVCELVGVLEVIKYNVINIAPTEDE